MIPSHTFIGAYMGELMTAEKGASLSDERHKYLFEFEVHAINTYLMVDATEIGNVRIRILLLR